MEQQSIKIIIPSHKRAKTITTHKVIKNGIVCIPESQFSEYKEHIGSNIEIVTHPDNIIGISAKRQWIYDKFGDFFSIDDDLQFAKRIYTEVGEKEKLTSEEINSIVNVSAQSARAAGSYLFGFNLSGKPFTYNALSPISLSGYINVCAFGMLKGSKLFFRPEQRMNEDYWLSGLNAYYHRKIWKDNRFYFHFGNTWTGSGGLAEFRNIEALEKDFKELQKFFGKDVIVQRKSGTKNHAFQMNFTTQF